MIVRNRPNTFKLLFTIQGSIIPKIIPHIISALLFSLSVVVIYELGYLFSLKSSLTPFIILGISLSIFLGFRNNAAYDRWWEARKQWGAMILEVRALSKSLNALALPIEHKTKILNYALAHSFALKNQLRNESNEVEIQKIIGEEAFNAAASMVNKADYYLQLLSDYIGECYQSNLIDSIGVQTISRHIHAFSSIQASCERISNTAIPFAYTLLVHRTSYVYCYLLPFILVSHIGWTTPLFTVIVVYTFFGLDILSEELEEPFGRAPNDLALDAMCRVNEISVAQALGVKIPEPLKPVNHKLE